MAAPLTPSSAPLARAAREQFVGSMEGVLLPLAEAIRTRLLELASGGARDARERREMLAEFERGGGRWAVATQKAWRVAVAPATATARVRMNKLSQLELIGDDVVENKILSSRLAMAVQEKAVWDLNELKLRIQHLEGGDDLATEDVLRPEALAQIMVEQWTGNGLTRETWATVKDVIHGRMTEQAIQAYHLTNEFLVDKGVLREIELSAKVRRPSGASEARTAAAEGDPQHSRPDTGAATGREHSGAAGVHDETRMMTSSPPLARARARASGVLGQLKRLLIDKVAGFDSPRPAQMSPGLAEALAQHSAHVQSQVHTHVQTRVQDGGEVVVFDESAVEEIAQDLRSRTSDLKRKASTSSEKATIEIVALMFQAILAEERIPAAVRVWFARLQMPVLRVAIAEPEFFGSLEHPARQLIDRMGSCVLGFDASAISGSAMETEIKRVVQVIEQYPETGRRVFQLVYEEFQRFLSKFLTEKGPTQRLVSVAQQVEQKETMAIQYTIELRKMLSDVPVRDEIREFLFKIWAEVLAVAAVKHGPQHQETVALKQAAADLLWAASAKPNRNDRARVIHELPKLLLRLRQGMALLGLQEAKQEAHIKEIGDTLADAFLSKTEAIPHARIEDMAKRLANLEHFVADDPAADLPLDQDNIELMLGIDASMIEVIADGGSMPNAAMLGWAQELQLGNWFSLDHNGKSNQVQYAWRSERGQLHLFASPGGRSFLIQLRRLAAYLQAGLLLPTEEETLTVRATRDALAKLDANPERLLQ